MRHNQGHAAVREAMQGCPAAVPWDFDEQDERRAIRNHGQTLERLAERGGLSPVEYRAVKENVPYDQIGGSPEDHRNAVAWINAYLADRALSA